MMYAFSPVTRREEQSQISDHQLTLRSNRNLKSLPEKSSCKEADLSDESEDNTEDDVGEEVSNQLRSFKDHGSVMSPSEKPGLGPRVHLQEIPELQDEDRNHRNITAPAI